MARMGGGFCFEALLIGASFLGGKGGGLGGGGGKGSGLNGSSLIGPVDSGIVNVTAGCDAFSLSFLSPSDGS